MNLAAYPAGDIYEVPAGGRRFGALEELHKAGLIPDDHPVYCIIIEKKDADDYSLIENFQRKAPHAADVYTAFSKLVSNGKTINDVAVSYGITETQVEKYLRLGNVHKTLFNMFARDDLSIEQITAYASTANKKLQLATFKLLGESLDVHPRVIRTRLHEGCGTSESGVAKFVTLEKYIEAGGSVENDLFEETTTLHDLGLLTDLAENKLANIAADITGWKWVETNLGENFNVYGYASLPTTKIDVPVLVAKKQKTLEKRLEKLDSIDEESWNDKLSDEYDQIEEMLNDLRDEIDRDYSCYADADMLHAGCVVTINQSNGEVEIHRGLMTGDDLKTYRNKDAGGDTGSSDSGKTVEKSTSDISARLKEDLGLYRRSIIASELAKTPKLAVDLLHFQLCTSVFAHGMDKYMHTLDVRLSEVSNESSIGDYQETESGKALESIRAKLETSWLTPKTEVKRFEAFRTLSPAKKQGLVSFATAVTLQSGTSAFARDKVSAYLCSEMDIKFEQHWRPTADNYFHRITTTVQKALGKKLFGAKWHKEHEKANKQKLVAHFDDLFNGSADSGSDKERSVKANWLPDEISK